jgi:hypothetical protein
VSKYTGIQKEHQLKNLVFDDYFDSKRFSLEQELDNIDFVITNPQTRGDLFADAGDGASTHYLWAEAKKGMHDVFDMFTQLILTCKKAYQKGEYLAPSWLGCFDEARIVFVPFHDMLPIFSETDFNWNATPSNHKTLDFQKAREKVKALINAKIVVYTFGADDSEIRDFIKMRFIAAGGQVSVKILITKDTFVQIFIKWVKEVKPFINISKSEWLELKGRGILDCDFYRADVMSRDGTTITEKLKIVLGNDKYKFQEYMNGRLFTADIDFTDGGEAYRRFWNKYGRPPAEEYQQYIIDRRDLLVPQNIREMKGSFFTPKIWVDKSKEYLVRVFGNNWQEEYYVWDCAAGTGNLLAGLTNEYNVWASDIEQGNVETIQALIDIDEKLNLLPAHVFQFDFLNDSFDKLPMELKKIIDDPEKRKKLIMYINPPYAESSGGERAKSGVSKSHSVHGHYLSSLGKSSNELFSLFMAHIYYKIPEAKLAVFSTLKYLNSSNFRKFRVFFNAEYKGGFMCQADTFDNVKGRFPVGFLVWNPAKSTFPDEIRLDVYNTNGDKIGEKGFYNGFLFINDWIGRREHIDEQQEGIGTLYFTSNDFQQNNLVYISMVKSTSHISCFQFTEDSLIKGTVYFAIRHCFEHTWINHNDQFSFPNDVYKTDEEFQNDCLIFTLFHGKNYISTNDGVNHWIPFTEKQVGAKEKFASNFMSDFLRGKTFSLEAQAVLCAGEKLWQYYHAKTKTNRTVSVNASYYDIREFFQGRNDKGTMNVKSTDETYNQLLGALRDMLKALTRKIQPKVYLYGFLRE